MMKRTVIAALAALLAVTMTACGNKDKKDGSGRVEKLPPATQQTTAEEDTTEAEETAAPETTQAEESDEPVVIELKDPDAEDSGAESKAADNAGAGAPFTFKADSSKWIVEQDDVSAAITYNSDDIQFAKGNCTVMINARTVEDMEDRGLSELADAIVDSKGLTDKVTVSSRGESVLGGHDAYKLSCLYTVNGVEFDLDIYVMAEGTQVIETWVMSYKDCTDAMQANFEQVLDTVAFK